MARWEEVLDVQLRLHDWLTSRHGLMFGGGYFQSAYTNPAFEYTDGEQTVREGAPSWTSPEDARRKGIDWARSIGVSAFNAEPIYVEPDMMTVVEAAVAGFAPEPLAETDLLTPEGLLVLPRSMWLTDPKGKRLSWRVALWSPRPNGIHLVLFHDVNERDDIDDQDTDFADYLKASGQRWTADLLPTHVVNWTYGSMHPGDEAHDISPKVLDGDTASIVRQSSRGDSAHRQLQATWRLLSMYLAVHTRQRPPRQAWKRAKARSLPHEHITVVRLRRPAQEKQDTEPTTVHWTHRWVVGGHWRNQWYASVGVHRQIWIAPFVKGPEEAPLVVNKARVFEFVR